MSEYTWYPEFYLIILRSYRRGASMAYCHKLFTIVAYK